MNIKIRRSSISDLGFLEKTEREAFEGFQQSTKRSLKQSLQSAHQQVWIAETQAGNKPEPAGCLILYFYPKRIRIFSIAVLKSFSGKGMGNELLKKAETIAREQNKTLISLEVNKQNTKLQEWYKKAGYLVKEELPDYYGEGLDGIKMEKVLK